MIRKVKVKDIRPNPFQSRKDYEPDSIKSLASEIDKVGLWAGALRGRDNNGYTELCFGHRRLAAIKHLGWKEVDVDVIDLSDEDMALQALVENLQREGLNDVDKGEGIKKYIELRAKSANIPNAISQKEIGAMIGLPQSRVSDLLAIAGFKEPTKEKIRKGAISGRRALEAYRIGGEEAIDTAIAKELPLETLQSIGRKIRDIDDPDMQEQVREKVAKGKVTSGEKVVHEARRLEAKKKEPKAPPDLIIIIGNWTVQINQWNRQLDKVIPYLEYIDTQPKIAEAFRTAVRELMDRLEKFL